MQVLQLCKKRGSQNTDFKDTRHIDICDEASTCLCHASSIIVTPFASQDQYTVQAFMSGAHEAGALRVVPGATDVLGYLASYTARLPAGPAAYYINDRFLLSVPDELVESLLGLFANATSAASLMVFGQAPESVAGRDNSDTAFGYRDTWYIWVWPFWLRTAGGAAVDGMPC